MGQFGLLRVVSNSELRQQEIAAAQVRQAEPVVLGLASYINKCWDAAKIAKKPIEDQMLKNLRQRNGEYEASTLTAIRQQGGSEIYMMITEVKCRAAESWLRDILLDTGTPPWDLKPTPIPDLPEDVTSRVQQEVTNKVLGMIQATGRAPSDQELASISAFVASSIRTELLKAATKVADSMKAKIEDQFADGGWATAINQFISDLVTYPCAFIKGPIVRKNKELDWSVDPATKKMSPTVAEKLITTWERVDPYRFYVEPGITNIDEGYVIEQHRLTKADLLSLIGVPGYDDGAIQAVLQSGGYYTDGQLLATETQKATLENKPYIWLRPSDTFDAIQFWGSIDGQMLLDWGMDETEIPDPNQVYPVEAWLVGNYVIKAVLNYDPLGQKPYYKSSFIKIPGAFWGRGIPEIIADIQQMCNAAARALSNNMGISSGPQVVINSERLPAGEPITQIYPWKIWQVTNDPMGSSTSQPAVSFEQPNSNADVLLTVYEKFSKMADDHSGIPAYIYGDTDVSGAGRTASGLSMLMGSAGKGIRQVIMYMDMDVIRPAVERQYIFNMKYDPDESIKGDCEIIPLATTNLATKEQLNVRRTEFLQATANPIDMQIIGLKGRASILREVAKGLEMPYMNIVPPEEEIEYMEQIQQAQMQSAPPQQSPESTSPGGQEKGGQEGNTVMNRNTGRS